MNQPLSCLDGCCVWFYESMMKQLVNYSKSDFTQLRMKHYCKICEKKELFTRYNDLKE